MAQRHKLVIEQLRTQQIIINTIQETNNLIDRLTTKIEKRDRQNDFLMLGLIVLFIIFVINHTIYYYNHP